MKDRYEIRSWVCDYGIFDTQIGEFIGLPIDSYNEAEVVLSWFTAYLNDDNVPSAISRFFKEMAEKHDVKVDDLNIHISHNTLYIQEYTPDSRNEYRCLEMVEII